jgi:hypothetical protein
MNCGFDTDVWKVEDLCSLTTKESEMRALCAVQVIQV